MTVDIKTYLHEQKIKVEAALQRLTPGAKGVFSKHMEAMRYSLFVGGKRIRPILCLAGATAIGGESAEPEALPVACALECIHTYSLIHDDLPAMDNDDLRRGQPTNHKVFGEAAAILAGDGLLTFAFELLSGSETQHVDDAVRLRIIRLISKAAGSEGMVGGQSLDMLYEGKKVGYMTLRNIHRSKTGALISAAVLSGAMLAGATESQLQALRAYGEQIGLAFQIVDDILDMEASTEDLGKTAGSDLEAAKVTYPSLFGLEQSHRMAEETQKKAILALSSFDEKADPLRALATYIVARKN